MEVNFEKTRLRAINALFRWDELVLLVLETVPCIRKLWYRKMHLYIQESLNKCYLDPSQGDWFYRYMVMPNSLNPPDLLSPDSTPSREISFFL